MRNATWLNRGGLATYFMKIILRLLQFTIFHQNTVLVIRIEEGKNSCRTFYTMEPVSRVSMGQWENTSVKTALRVNEGKN